MIWLLCAAGWLVGATVLAVVMGKGIRLADEREGLRPRPERCPACGRPLSEEQMRHWPACRAEGTTCGVHAEPWPCHFGRLVDAVALLADALDEAETERDELRSEVDALNRSLAIAMEPVERLDEAVVRAEKAEAQVQTLIGDRAEAQAAVDRVRALCDPSVGMATACRPGVRHIDAADVLAAIDGEAR